MGGVNLDARSMVPAGQCPSIRIGTGVGRHTFAAVESPVLGSWQAFGGRSTTDPGRCRRETTLSSHEIAANSHQIPGAANFSFNPGMLESWAGGHLTTCDNFRSTSELSR